MNILQEIFKDNYEQMIYELHPRQSVIENVDRMINCGTKYSIDRTASMSFKIVNVQHRHCVFTIDSELRPFFLQDRSLLGLLFDAVQSVILRMFHKENKTEQFTPGFICVLHTFGRDLKWNPHIHCLVSEGGIDKSGLWHANKHFKLYRKTINKYGILQSMNSAGGRCHDNARCESMWARFKEELLYGRYDTTQMTVEQLKTLI